MSDIFKLGALRLELKKLAILTKISRLSSFKLRSSSRQFSLSFDQVSGGGCQKVRGLDKGPVLGWIIRARVTNMGKIRCNAGN